MAWNVRLLPSGISDFKQLRRHNRYYVDKSMHIPTAPEVELNHGYCDFFLMPDMERRPGVEHSYIPELKHLKSDATQQEAGAQWHEAAARIRGYGQGVRVLKRHTQPHLIVVQQRGYDLKRMEEILA